MIFLSDIPSIQTAIFTFAMTNASRFPAGVETLYQTAASKVSPVDTIVSVAECLYAGQSLFTDSTAQAAARTLAGQCAAFAAQYAWHGMDVRGPGIVSAMRRDLGEAAPAGQAWPDPTADPPPLAAWSPAAA
jgi:hypothetical protein